MDEKEIIRVARPEDAPALLGIYGPYIEHTAITFEYTVPTPEQFAGRISHTLEQYPYLVAERQGEPVGYAYAGTFVGRAACSWSAEVSVYIRQDQRRTGLGGRLYDVLERILQAQNVQNMNASIALPEQDDPYLTKNSALFHEHLGFTQVGAFHNCGYKFGSWYSLLWVEKQIGEHGKNPAPVIPFPQLSPEVLRKAGVSV